MRQRFARYSTPAPTSAAGSTTPRDKEDQRAEDSRAETGRHTMIRSDNLRSGNIQDDIEEYLYKLLPERDAAVSEMESYAADNRVPIIGPAVRLLTARSVPGSRAGGA